MTRMHRRRLRALGLRVRRGLRRHYLSVLSATVLAVAASQALTAPAFEGGSELARGGGTQALAGVAPPRQVAAIGAQATIASVTERMRLRAKQRRLALVYLVMSEAQGKEVVQTYRTLIWDMPAPETMRPVTVEYLIADTVQAEAAAVQVLNGLAGFLDPQEVDLRIIDLRPARRPANTGLP